jgi:hypothetical protein
MLPPYHKKPYLTRDNGGVGPVVRSSPRPGILEASPLEARVAQISAVALLLSPRTHPHVLILGSPR